MISADWPISTCTGEPGVVESSAIVSTQCEPSNEYSIGATSSLELKVTVYSAFTSEAFVNDNLNWPFVPGAIKPASTSSSVAPSTVSTIVSNKPKVNFSPSPVVASEPPL